MTVSTRCLNCGADVTGVYCSGCGQEAETARITFPRLLRNAVDHVLSVDSSVLRTAGALFRRPGDFIRSFLLGRRVGYSRPLPYYLLVVALNVGASTLLRHSTGTDSTPGDSFWEENFVALQIALMFGLMMVPLAGARRLLHDDDGYSIAEHFVFLLYVLAQSILLTLGTESVLSLFGVPPGTVEGPVWLTAFVVYVIWASRGFLAEPIWKVALKLVAAIGMVLAGIGVVAAIVYPFLGKTP